MRKVEEVSMSRRAMFVVFALFTLVLVFALGCSEESEENQAPVIVSSFAVPDTVGPTGFVTMRVEAYDPDTARVNAEFDSLRYDWSAEAGYFLTNTNDVAADWQAPVEEGRVRIFISVSDGDIMVMDTLSVVVDDRIGGGGDGEYDWHPEILSPGDSTIYILGEQAEFIGGVVLDANVGASAWQAEWSSSLDGVFNNDPPDSLGLMSFQQELSAGSHLVTLTVTRNSSETLQDSITVIFSPNIGPVELYPVERIYQSNRLTWLHDSGGDENFQRYSVRRSSSTGFVELASIEDINTRTYTDTSLVLGETYTYEVWAYYEGGLISRSCGREITAGVYTDFGTTIPDMYYDNPSEYLFTSHPELDLVYATDVTANNVDYFWAFSDSLFKLTGDPADTSVVTFSPHGFGLDEAARDLYVCSPGDSAVWWIELDGFWWDRIADLRYTGDKPHYADFDEERQILYTTANNRYPFVIENPLGGDNQQISRIPDSRLVVNNSLLIMDDPRDMLYISELGHFPSSLWKYDVSGPGSPQLVLEDTHNTLGYFLWDMALTPTGFFLYLASESPHYVQKIDTGNFSLAGQIEVGPSPNSLWLTEDGSTLYVGVGTDVQKWNLDTNTLEWVIPFKYPIKRRGIEVSQDERILMIGMDHEGSASNSWVFIIYLW